jgi:hypothetical protein
MHIAVSIVIVICTGVDGVDGADGSELGHGARYCCVDCGGRKVSGTSKRNEEVRVRAPDKGRGTRPRKQQPQRASTTKTPSESNDKRSMKGWKTVGI